MGLGHAQERKDSEETMDNAHEMSLQPEQIHQALETLPTADWTRLRMVANALSRTGRVEPEDLLQGAIERALDGRRVCPIGIDVVRFLAEAMKSIASDAAKAARRRPSSARLDDQPDIDARSEAVDERLISESEAIAIREEVLKLFDDDEVAKTIVEGDMDEMTPDELQNVLNVDGKTYASARRKIRRRIDNNFPNGWRR